MSFKQNYSAVDKTLHYLAFSIPTLRMLLCDVENHLYKQEISEVKSTNEVFISGLPRSGTTLLLEVLNQTQEFNSFSYRHMPFIYSPLLWKKLSKPFVKKGASVERAHGDGMKVDFDSPEAFEEVLWINYLKDKFVKKDHLIPLTLKNTTTKFADNFRITIKKLLLESQEKNAPTGRYISKNNANCSRIEVITKIFPSSVILIPFREPLAHIGSLMRQHQQFTKMHKDDKFAQNYMRWLGHFDFGENFKPIDFDQWLKGLNSPTNYLDENFWLQYWVAAYQHILDRCEKNVYLIDYDKLLTHPEIVLATLAKQVNLNNPQKLIDCSKLIRSPTSKPRQADNIVPPLLEKALSLHKKLQQVAS